MTQPDPNATVVAADSAGILIMVDFVGVPIILVLGYVSTAFVVIAVSLIVVIAHEVYRRGRS